MYFFFSLSYIFQNNKHEFYWEILYYFEWFVHYFNGQAWLFYFVFELWHPYHYKRRT